MNPRFKPIMIFSLQMVCCWAYITQLFVLNAFGQSEVNSERSRLASQLAMLDPSNEEEFGSQVDSLRLAIQKETDSMLRDAVACYLALVGDDRQALRLSIDQITANWNDVPADLRPTIMRLSLVIAIEAGDEKRGTSIYKELTRAALREDVALATRRENAELIGFLNGLLGTDEGTIASEVRNKAEGLLSQVQVANRSYSTGNQNGKEVRAFLDEQKLAWEQLEPLERISQIKKDQLEMEEIEADRVLKQQEAKSENADQRAAWTTIFATRKRLVGNLSLVIEDSRYPTPGHPGAPPVKPAEPNRDSIKVNEYEIKKEKRGDKTVEVKERRSQSEIEREKDQKFFAWQQRYAVEKPNYDQKIATYRGELQAWTVLDNMRRTELFDLYTDLTSRIDRIDQEKKAVDQSKKEAMEEIDHLSTAIRELRKKNRIWKQLEEGDHRGANDGFLRASVWEGIESQREQQQVLRWIRAYR